MDLIVIGLIALAFTILLLLANRDQRDRRDEMGLPPLPPPSPEAWNWPPRNHARVARTSSTHVNAAAASDRPAAETRR